MVRSLDNLITSWKKHPRDKEAIKEAEQLRDYLTRKAHDYDARYTQWLDEQLALEKMLRAEATSPRAVKRVGENPDPSSDEAG